MTECVILWRNPRNRLIGAIEDDSGNIAIFESVEKAEELARDHRLLRALPYKIVECDDLEPDAALSYPEERMKAEIKEQPAAQSYKGKLNIYVCDECHGHIVTKDIDDGVTPFMIGCEAKGCKSMMKSSFYRVFDQSMAPSHEWYKPSEPEIATLQRGAADHVRQGGLLLRRCDGAPMKHPLTRR